MQDHGYKGPMCKKFRKENKNLKQRLKYVESSELENRIEIPSHNVERTRAEGVE